MAKSRLVVQTKKDKHPFFHRTDAKITKYTKALSFEEQREVLNYMTSKIQEMWEDLEKLGLDSSKIYFSIAIKE